MHWTDWKAGISKSWAASLPMAVFCSLIAAWMTSAAPLLGMLPFISPAPDVQAAIMGTVLVLLTTTSVFVISTKNKRRHAPTTSIQVPLQILLTLLIGIGLPSCR